MTRNFCTALALGVAVLAAAQAAEMTADDADRETQQLMDQLKKTGDQILANTQSPNLYRHQLDQGEVLMRLAARSKPDGRDSWLKMAIDSYATAVSQAPENMPNPHEWLGQVSSHVARTYPSSTVQSYIAYKAVYAEHVRAVVKGGADAGKAQDRLCDRLMAFARAHPKAAEAPKAVMEVIEANEAAKKIDAAKAACRYLGATYPADPLAKKARETMWRLGLEGEVIELKLPLLYPSGASDETFDLQSVRGRVTVVYFWTASNAADADFGELRDLGDRYRRQGIEVVFVNADATPTAGRDYLSNKLTGGTHVHQKGGVEGEVTARYGIRTLPETLLIGADGALVARATNPSGVEAGVVKQLGPVQSQPRRR
ncbi:MAG: TlpA family protein disulfide reductase [Gemmataceae bacterium]